MSARLRQLEAQSSTLGSGKRAALVREYIESASALRSLLLRVAIGASIAEILDQAQFEITLGEPLRWAYLWAIEDVESLANSFSQSPPTEPHGLPLHDLVLSPAAVADLEAADDSADQVISALGAIDEALAELARRRRRVDLA